MINNFYLKILDFLINLIDLTNRIKIISFLKKKTLNKKLVIFDVGAHKGETLKIFKNNFNFEKILCFEPNKKIFKTLIKKYDYLKNSNIFFINCGLSDKIELKQLNVLQDTSSSTFSKINEDSAYFRRKKKIIDLFSTNAFYKKVNVNVKTISYFIRKYNLDRIDILKIDTEGSEFKILNGVEKKYFEKINFIYFEHHYDLMLDKGYKFSDINELLKNNNFKMIFKIKMKFRKTFEYIYEKKNRFKK
jgi:FkbM family methyltransferase